MSCPTAPRDHRSAPGPAPAPSSAARSPPPTPHTRVAAGPADETRGDQNTLTNRTASTTHPQARPPRPCTSRRRYRRTYPVTHEEVVERGSKYLPPSRRRLTIGGPAC